MAIRKRPISPRQKMINLMYVVLMAMLALNVSTEVLNGFSIVEESLNRTTGNSTKQNQAIYDDRACSPHPHALQKPVGHDVIGKCVHAQKKSVKIAEIRKIGQHALTAHKKLVLTVSAEDGIHESVRKASQ